MLTHASLMNILYPMVAAFTQQKGKLCENKRTKFVETCLNKNANSFATSFRQDFVVKGSCEYFRQSSISGVKNDPESTWLANTSTETIELASNAFEKSTILQKMVEYWSTNIRSKAPIKVRIRFGFTLSGTFIRTFSGFFRTFSNILSSKMLTASKSMTLLVILFERKRSTGKFPSSLTAKTWQFRDKNLVKSFRTSFSLKRVKWSFKISRF